MTIADVVGITVGTKHVAAGETPGDLRVSKAFGMQQTKPATWEGSVLPAWREHASRLPGGVQIQPVVVTPTQWTAEARLNGAWATTCCILRDTHDMVNVGVRGLVRYAEKAHADYLRNLSETAKCPVCQAIGGWRPRCGACEVAALAPSSRPASDPCTRHDATMVDQGTPSPNPLVLASPEAAKSVPRRRFEPGQRVIVTASHGPALRHLVGQEAVIRGNTGQTLILGFANGEAYGWDPAHVKPAPDLREQLCAAAS